MQKRLKLKNVQELNNRLLSETKKMTQVYVENRNSLLRQLSNNKAENAAGFKLFSIAVIWILGFGGGILPYYVRRTNASLMSLLNCFSGGVFLAGGFLHLLHAAIENPALKAWSNHEEYAFPYAEMFCTIGFLSVFCLEQAGHELQRSYMHGEKNDMSLEEISDMGILSNRKGHVHESLNLSETSRGKSAVAVVLFVALSFHSILEGLGIGAQKKAEWGIFTAIVVHKGLAAFALGSGMLQSRMGKRRFILNMFVFSLMSIIGILVGWAISVDGSEDSAAAGICLALASGTFIYVAVMEVLPKEFSNHVHVYRKTVYVLLGYMIFGILAKWS